MGDPFSNTKKTYASSVTTKVLEEFDDPLPGLVAGAAVTGQDLTTTIVDYFNGGIFSKTEKYFKYGRDHFVRGLPEEITINSTIDLDELKRIIETEEGFKIKIIYAVMNNDLVGLHYVSQYLQDIRGMDYITQKISITTGITVPVGYSVYYKDLTYLDDFKYVQINYWVRSDSSPTTQTVHSELFEYNPGSNYIYQVQYVEMDGRIPLSYGYYWSYTRGSGGHPTLDGAVVRDTSKRYSYYPVVPFYENKTQIGDPANKGTPLYDTSRTLVKKLGIDYEAIVESLAEGTDESIGKNKGLYAYMMLGAELTAGIPKFADAGKTDAEKLIILKNAQATINYLIDYFSMLYASAYRDRADYDAWLDPEVKVSEPLYNTAAITDDSFKMIVQWNYIDYNVKPGVIGKLDWCTNEFVLYTTEYHTATGVTGIGAFAINSDSIILRKQITINSYVEIIVYGLVQRFTIFDDTDSITYLRDAFREENPALMTVPLHRNTVLMQPNRYRNRLMHAALVFVFNSYQIQEIKWYEDEAWGVVILIASIVFAIPTGGYSLTWNALFTVAAITAAAYAFLIMVIRYIIFREIIKLVAKEFGAETAFILALVLIAYGKGAKNGSLPGAPFASALMNAGTTMWSATSKYVQDQLKDLQKDYAKLDSETKKLNDELERAQNLLDNDMAIDPWLFVNPIPNLILGQGADEYMQISLNQNPGIMALQAPSNYAEIMLTLPSTNDSLNPTI